MADFGEAIRVNGATPEFKRGQVNESAFLMYINVCTASTSASLSVYRGTSTNGSQIALIDCSSATGRVFEFMVRCNGGVYGVLTPAATGADCTVTVL